MSMDKDEFKQRVSELAEIKDIKPAKSGAHNRFTTEIVIETDEFGEEYEVEREITDNPTLGFALVKLKPIEKPCQLGCGRIVEDQIIEQRMAVTPFKHYRTRCKNCARFLSPNGSFVNGHQIVHEYIVWKAKQNK